MNRTTIALQFRKTNPSNGSGYDETRRRIGSSIPIQRFIWTKHQSVENTFPKLDGHGGPHLSINENGRGSVIVLAESGERLDTD